MTTRRYHQRVYSWPLPATGLGWRIRITVTKQRVGHRLPGRLGDTPLGQMQLPLGIAAVDITAFVTVAGHAETVSTSRGRKYRASQFDLGLIHHTPWQILVTVTGMFQVLIIAIVHVFPVSIALFTVTVEAGAGQHALLIRVGVGPGNRGIPRHRSHDFAYDNGGISGNELQWL